MSIDAKGISYDLYALAVFGYSSYIYNSISQLILKIPWITSDVDYDVLRFEISSEKRILKS